MKIRKYSSNDVESPLHPSLLHYLEDLPFSFKRSISQFPFNFEQYTIISYPFPLKYLTLAKKFPQGFNIEIFRKDLRNNNS